MPGHQQTLFWFQNYNTCFICTIFGRLYFCCCRSDNVAQIQNDRQDLTNFYATTRLKKVVGLKTEHSRITKSVSLLPMPWTSVTASHAIGYGHLTRYANLRVAHAPRTPGTFSPPPTSEETASQRSRHASRHGRHANAMMHVGIAKPRWRGKLSRHSGRMRNPPRNPQFCVSVRGTCRINESACFIVRVRTSTTCAISKTRNDRKCNHVFYVS